MCMTEDLPEERRNFICKGIFMCLTDDLQQKEDILYLKGSLCV